MAVAVALTQMFNRANYFNICTLDSALEAAGIVAPHAQYAPLRVLHCVYYADMPPGFKKDLAERVMALFSLPADFKIAIEAEQIAPNRWLKLLR